MSMKKLLLAMTLLLPLAAMAQHWQAPTSNAYPNETPVYVKVNINGVAASASDGLELAAFIDGVCRADTLMHVDYSAPAPVEDDYFCLRVWGDLSTDASKTIIFRAFDSQFAYEFTTTAIKFDGESHGVPSNPIVLNLDRVTGVTLTNPIVINQPEAKYPYYVDLSQYISFQYNTMTGAPYTPLQESNVLTEGINYNWSSENYNLSFMGNTMTVQKEAANDGDITINLTCTPQPGVILNANTTLQVNIQAIAVSSITCDIASVDLWAYEDIRTVLSSHISVKPDEASLKTYHFECETPGALEGDMFTAGGNYELKIIPDDANYNGQGATVNVTVYVRPTNIAATNPTITVHYNEDVYAAIEANQTLTWPGSITDPGQWAKNDVNYTFSQPGYVSELGKATKFGTVTVTVTLKDGITPSMAFMGQDSYTVTVNIVSQLNVTAAEPATPAPVYKKGVQAEAPVYVYVENPYNEPFDANTLTITFDERYTGKAYATQVGIVQKEKDGLGRDVYAFTIKPLYIGSARFRVIYDNPNVPLYVNVFDITKEEELSTGWTWLSVPTTGGAVSTLLTQDDIVEIRSQDELLINDPKLGYVGGIINLEPYESMYKVKTNKATTVNWGSKSYVAGASFQSKTTRKGYNWVNYPYEFDIEANRIADFLGADFTPADGDIIKTQDGFATYDGTQASWVADASFALKEGKGFMYYSTADEVKFIGYSITLEPSNTNAGARGMDSRHEIAGVFEYDKHAFADNMSMVAKIQGLDTPEDYTLGAFVGDECRGRGSVAVDGKMFVNAVGKSGEVMTFKLVNNLTGEMMPIEGTVDFSPIKGSLRAPVMLTAGEATAIRTVSTAAGQASEAYDLSGRRITGSQHGLSIERTTDGKVRKVVKK